jgi:TonB-dependent starch-binding outer membrane protein SusC
MRQILPKNCLMAVLCLVSSMLWAQDRTITGTITSTEDGSKLPGVNVVVKGTTIGAVSDADGSYSISVPSSGGTLVFSFIGLRSVEVEIGSQTQVSIEMETDVTQLSEVVVTGYGVAPKRQISGAISSVKGSDIANLPMQSFDRALQGRAAGVLVQSNNGIPGGSVNIRIRGTGSISAGNTPLYIVDGVQINSRSDANFTQSNPLAFLNASDIASIEILKDAASAAIYGAQASNGVVIITTKKGQSGKPSLTFNYYTGVNQQLKYVDVLDAPQWFELRKSAYQNGYIGSAQLNETGASYFALQDMGLLTGLTVPNNLSASTIGGWGSANALNADDLQLGRFSDGTIGSYDWQREAFSTGKVQNYELSFSGGDDKNKYYISASYNKQDATMKPVDFQRGTVKLDVTNTLTPKLKLASSMNLSTFQQNIPFAVSGSFLGSPAFSASAVQPQNAIYNPEDGSFNTAIAGVLNQNVIAVVNQNSGVQRTNQAVGNLTFTYDIVKGLNFRSLWGLDYRLVQGERFTDPRTPDGVGVRGRSSLQTNWNTNFITTQTLNFAKSISDHNVNGLVGFEYRSETNEGFTASKTGFPTYQFRTLGSGAVTEAANGGWTGYHRVSGFGQVNYDFKKKYIATFTVRRDGSSRFGSENRYGLFKSVSAAWIVKEESFLSGVNALTDLKLRASYGETGNDDIGDFPAVALYSGGTAVNYNGTPGIRPSGLANIELGWETNETVNAGVDFGFFNSRISSSIDLYRRTSKDLLLVQPVPAISGFDSYIANVGEMVNRGVEVEVNTVNIDMGGFLWKSTFNFAYNENYVSELYGGLQELPGVTSVRVGRSIGTLFTQEYAGVNPATGRPMWYDINRNLTYQPTAADRIVVGNNQPEFYGGFINSLSYKGFSIDAQFNYEYGRIVSDAQVSFLRENATRLTLNALEETAERRWTTPGQITDIPRSVISGAEVRGVGQLTGSANFLKADFIRLKQLTLSYNVDKSLINKIGVNSARVYAQGVNLWTYSDYLGYDPEFVDVANGGSGIIPQSKGYTFGIQLGF